MYVAAIYAKVVNFVLNNRTDYAFINKSVLLELRTRQSSLQT